MKTHAHKPLAACWLAAVFIATCPAAFAQEANDTPPADDGPLHALVLLTDQPATRTLKQIQEAVEAGIGQSFSIDEENNDATRFIVGEAPLFIVRDEDRALLINVFDKPYWDPEQAAKWIDDPPLQNALQAHRGWISVDLLLDDEPVSRAELEARYREIGKILVGLADEHALVAFAPATENLAIYDEALGEAMRTGDPVDAIGEPLFAAIVRIADDDPRMLAAIKEARQRWPEFVAAFADRGENKVFIVKVKFTEGDDAEHMWCEVTAATANGGAGQLANTPRDLTQVHQGDAITFTHAQISDWAYTKGDDVAGYFSIKVIELMEAEAARE